MDVSSDDTPGSRGSKQGAVDHSIPGLRNRMRTASSIERRSSVSDHNTKSIQELRSTVEWQFMRMNEGHDRIRTKVLAAHSEIR